MNEKKKVVVFGVGNNWKNYRKDIEKNYEVIALTDNRFKDENKMGGSCIPPHRILEIGECFVLVLPSFEARLEIARQLVSLGVPKNNILFYLPEAYRYWNDWHVNVVNNNIHAVFDGIKFDVIHNSDADILDEIYINLDYGFVTNANSLLVLDIGMNVGLASLFFASWENVTEVYGFEPFKPTYEGALHNFNQNSEAIRDKLHPQNIGLGNQRKTLKIDYNEDFPGGMSVYGQSTDDGSLIEIFEASEVIDPIISNSSHDKILAKIDTEGSEYDILENLSTNGILKKIDYLIMETHMAREKEAKTILSDNGFVYFYEHHMLGLGYIKAVRM